MIIGLHVSGDNDRTSIYVTATTHDPGSAWCALKSMVDFQHLAPSVYPVPHEDQDSISPAYSY